MFGSTPQKQIEKLEAKKVRLQAKIMVIDQEIAKLKAPPATVPAPAPVVLQAPVQTAPPPPQQPYYPPK